MEFFSTNQRIAVETGFLHKSSASLRIKLQINVQQTAGKFNYYCGCCQELRQMETLLPVAADPARLQPPIDTNPITCSMHHNAFRTKFFKTLILHY